jgi:regulator of RNase E activity RraA
MMNGSPKNPRNLRVSSASLTDALGRRRKHRAHVLDLVSPTPDRILFGPAVTMRYIPVRDDLEDSERHNFARLLYEGIGGEKPDGTGRVLVLSSSGHPGVSVGGGTKLSRLHNLGFAGIMTDGRLRDFSELAGYDFATWCAGESVR